MVTIGQIGIGTWGQNHTRIFSSINNCCLKICCDKNKEMLSKIKPCYSQQIRFTRDFKEILNDKDIEGVVITTPSVFHARLAIESFSRGKHVFVEKPMALNVRDGKRMLEAAHKYKRILMVGHLLLYHSAILKLKEYIDRGELGEVYYMYSTRVNLGQVRIEENALWSLTAHDISVALFLLEDKPVEVTAKGDSYLRKGIEDIVFVTVRFKNGILVHIHASWLDPHKMRKFTVVGSKKMAVFDDMESTEKIRIYDKGFDRQKITGGYETFLTLREGDIYIPKVNMIEPLKVECQHFLDCITQNSNPLTDGKSGFEVLKVLTAAQKSLETGGKPVRIL